MYKAYLKRVENEDFREELQIETEEGVIATYDDGGEPEDNLFCRDWHWIVSELERAYAKGKEDGGKALIVETLKKLKTY